MGYRICGQPSVRKMVRSLLPSRRDMRAVPPPAQVKWVAIALLPPPPQGNDPQARRENPQNHANHQCNTYCPPKTMRESPKSRNHRQRPTTTNPIANIMNERPCPTANVSNDPLTNNHQPPLFRTTTSPITNNTTTNEQPDTHAPGRHTRTATTPNASNH